MFSLDGWFEWLIGFKGWMVKGLNCCFQQLNGDKNVRHDFLII